jgi:hypothetical protein
MFLILVLSPKILNMSLFQLFTHTYPRILKISPSIAAMEGGGDIATQLS